MSESRIYNIALLAGIVILLGWIFFHSWMAVAIGAMIAGVGGVFGMLMNLKR